MVEEAISFWSEIQRFENMLDADPRSLSFAPLSEIYRKLGLLDDAISVAKRGCNLHPDYPGGFFALGAAYLEKGLKDDARPALERVLQLNPEHLHAQKLLAQLYVENGDIALAQKSLRKVLELNPDDAESSVLLHSLESMPELARASAARAPEEEILEDVEVIEDLEPLDEELETADLGEQPSRDPLTTATLAELYVSQGFLDKAVGIYQELIAAAPGNQGYRLRCAELKSAWEHQKEAAAGSAVAFELPAEEEESLDLEDDAPWEPFQVPVPPARETAPAFAAPPLTPVFEAPAPPAQAAQAPAVAASVAQEPLAIFEPEPFTVSEASDSFEDSAYPVAEDFPSFEELGAPAQQETAAVSEIAFLGADATAGGDGVEAELNSWLENIRRRRDGV